MSSPIRKGRRGHCDCNTETKDAMTGADSVQHAASILVDSIMLPNPLITILREARERLGAVDVCFRLRDWQDQSVVHVANWMIDRGPEEGQPELARRFYFDPSDDQRIDCVVGLVARVARIKEETGKGDGERDDDLIAQLKSGVSEDDIREQRIVFNDVQKSEVYHNLMKSIDSATSSLLLRRPITFFHT